MDSKNIVQNSKGASMQQGGLDVNDPNIILPKAQGGGNTKANSSRAFSDKDKDKNKEKVEPVIVRSFHRDMDEAMKKEKFSKEAVQLQSQENKPQKEKVRPAIPQKISPIPPVPVKNREKREISKNMPEAPTPPYKTSVKIADQKVLDKFSNKGQKGQLLNIPVPKKPTQAIEDEVEAKFLDKKDAHIPKKEIIFSKSTATGEVSEVKQDWVEKEKEEEIPKAEIVMPKSTSQKLPDKKVKELSFYTNTARSSLGTISIAEDKTKDEVLEKKQKDGLQKTHDIFDAMVSGEHIEKEKPENKKEPVAAKIKQETKKEGKQGVQFVTKPPVEKKPEEKPLEKEAKKKIEQKKQEEKPQTPAILEMHVSQEELNIFKSDIVRIDSEIKAFLAQRESTLAKKDQAEKEKVSLKAKIDATKDRISEKQRREKEITERIHQIEKKETQTENKDERHVNEKERWKQEDMRADIAQERLDIEESYEKIIASIREKEDEFVRAEESFKELEHQVKARIKEKEEKKLKVKLGEIESKKKEIEDIQVALLEEKRRLDRLHEDFESRGEQYSKDNELVEKEKSKATELADRKILEEKIVSIQKERRKVEQKRWEAEKSLEIVLEKIAKSNGHYTTISKLEQDVRESIAKAGK